MLKQTQNGLLLICDECGEVLKDKLERDLYFKNKNAFYLYYAYIEFKGWRGDKYCGVCNKWQKRVDKEKKKSVEANRNWHITLKELKNAVKFAEEYGNGECKVIGIGHYGGNLGDSPYVFDVNKMDHTNINPIYRISLIDNEDDVCL